MVKMNSNAIIKNILDKNPILLEEYEAGFNDELNYLRLKNRDPIKEHEWWREYLPEAQEETINDIDIATKFRLLGDSILNLTHDLNHNRTTLGKIFSTLEESLEGADEYVLGEIEILFLEGILNRVSHKSEIYHSFMSLLGPNSRFLCERNNVFWEKSGVTNGSVASAVRKEAKTGDIVGPRSHIKKAEYGIKSLERWIEENPTASPGDRAAAENLLKDLMNSLGY